MTEESLLEFPCEFPVKAMGKNDGTFTKVILEIIRRHAPDTQEHSSKTRPSKDGNYLSVTVTIQATSREQLDAIYRDLAEHPGVLMTL